MREFVFFFLYGMIAFTGLFLSWAWLRLALARLKLINGAWRHDRYFWLASAFGVNSLGCLFIYTARGAGNIIKGTSNHLLGVEGFVIGVGLSLLLLSQIAMVWLVDMERTKPRWLWIMGGITIGWAFLAAWFAASHQ